MSTRPIVLITGGTGFLGSHIISQLLAQGSYTVRAVARSANKLKSIFPNASVDQLQVIEIPTLTSDFTDALKNVTAVVHAASPIKDEGKQILEGAYYGTIHIVNQAIAAGVKKIVITGTFASLLDGDFKAGFGTKLITEKSFGNFTIEEVDLENPNVMAIYHAAKTLADKKVWEIAHQHTGVDITVLLPPAILGPYVPNFPINSRDSLGTNDFVYSLIVNGTDSYSQVIPVGHMIDVRDAARAHLLALSTGRIPGSDKRFIISARSFTWKEFADLYRKERPELKDRLPREDVKQGFEQTSAPLDVDFANDALGMGEYIDWKETALAALDATLILERK
ncbi:NAD(P)-binding protein [Dendrothele bispora CBS 962.96]|uniref:NAD(P)-binding protein n=1 Tax=Dendrothele bispora (strain CBS 962.96) TaxID=1314807 RepID=A0A4S8LZV8_DENBC|nr:NAD(P)-binding protein [Dendrothele bispora CBS 962.96]